MSDPMTCPPRTDLERLLLGQLPDWEAEPLETHLEDCPRCLRVLNSLRVQDALVEAVRAGGQDGPPSTVVTDDDDLIAALCRLPAIEEIDLPLTRVGVPPKGREWRFGPRLGPDELGQVGPYRVLRLLGTGGMGVVYLAEDTRLKRLVALKMIGTVGPGDSAMLARFRREAEAIARLQHPNIVQIHEVGEWSPSDAGPTMPYVALEYVAGGNLAQVLTIRPLAARPAAVLVETLARAIQAAHDRGVLHRDLKPANILLGNADSSGQAEGMTLDGIAAAEVVARSEEWEPKVTDFGLAKHLDDDRGVTHTGAVIGTPGYMAPEQANSGHPVGPAADIYALGAILYECVTGRPPFRAATVLETLDQARTQEPVPPRRLQPSVPRDLETICLKCLHKEPARRYATALSLAGDLHRFLAGEPIEARPVSMAERLLKWMRRQPVLAGLGLVSGGLLVGLVSSVIAYNAWLQAEVERAAKGEAEALRQRERADLQYREARATLGQMLARLDERGAAKIPQLGELERILREDALAFYLNAAKSEEATDPAVRQDIALAAYQAAYLQLRFDRSREAEANLLHAAEIYERLVQQYPDQAIHRKHLAECLGALAIAVGRRERAVESEQLTRRALEILQELARRNPEDFHLKDALARQYHNLGNLYIATKRNPQAHWEKSLELGLEAYRVNPNRVHATIATAETCTNLGLCYAAEQPEKAEAMYRQAEQLLKPLIQAWPQRLEYAATLGGVYNNWAGLLKQNNDPASAVTRASQALEDLEAVLRQEPTMSSALEYRFLALGTRAQALNQMGRYADSLRDWNRLLELSEPRDRDEYRVERAPVLARSGDHAGAAAEAEALLSRARGNGQHLVHWAEIYVLCLEAVSRDERLTPAQRGPLEERYAARAVELFEMARETGYFKDFQRRLRLKYYPGLEPLRRREDFLNLQHRIDESL